MIRLAPATVNTTVKAVRTRFHNAERKLWDRFHFVRVLKATTNSAFVNDLDIVAVRIEHPRRVVARIVFEPRLRSCLTLASGSHRRFVECIYLSVVFCDKSNMHRLGVGLSFLEPEKSTFAVAKPLQIGVSVLALVIGKVCDPKWLQSFGIKSDRALKITDRENNVVYHILGTTPPVIC
jgi:hypothetical protein